MPLITLTQLNDEKFKSSIALFLAIYVLSSCATVFGGKVNQYQRTKPLAGQQQRVIRPVALVADILLFWPGVIIDFATCAMYKPIPAEQTPVAAAPVSAVSN